jgi:hypothetical protein
MKTYIYILQDPTSNEVRYVGKSNNPLRRYKSHLWDKPKVKTHCNSWIKSLQSKGLSPVFTIIDEIEGDWELLEQYWIEQFKQWGFNLTNHTKGGQGVYGAGQWNNTPVTAYDSEGNFIKSFESQKACAKYFKTSQGNVKAAVSGRNLLLCKKYQICFGTNTDNIGKVASYKEYEWKNKPDIHWLSKRIECIEDKLVFNSQTEAASYYKIKVTTVNNILNGRAKKTRAGKSFTYC